MFFERPDSGEIAVLVHIDFYDQAEKYGPEEFIELSISAGADPVAVVVGSRQRPDPKYFIGSGKLEEIKDIVLREEAQVVLFDHALSPSQERNLEAHLNCRVLDRTGLILDIFAQRARTHEGKLQVELAQLQHMSTRLIRGWTHLERQKGGIGMRGPGETQLETDRRLLRERIKTIQKRLDKVNSQRDQSRRSRSRSAMPTVSLVGYTNAGKSTLFNKATGAEVYAADQLFATLDPTLRRLEVEQIGSVVLADTVGFIRQLPHRLVKAFQATLKESSEADLLLHVIDCADIARDDNIKEVDAVLEEIGASEVPTLKVFNKIDALATGEPRIDRDENGKPYRVWVSAKEGLGIDLLQQSIAELVGEDIINDKLIISSDQGRFRAMLFEQGAVRSEEYDEHGRSVLEVSLPKKDFMQLLARAGISEEQVMAA
ncbi:ribosome rescue GTPase HflX [Marinomonas mediterranea]|uniref:GTPase HflX n=1 Tax=Marinomonas mediterranea (strain ATCC 700492 / JCM 21426 / NBRC 103028 / MMB-1) TaxID=717774 RepID=F2JWL5_MARM1|nr:ribosome rescue GTPase HflX [Marinomonas mediterranea]ADZ91779.1 GTP-binding proten HflX [Marinomonas mediterranea MMB-1]WCN09735.1 GTPase HflX [Marinomonas mediterranea]WCN17872.1 GTPase HflX [Marinomonas mediterranea MMB-1]